MPELLYFRALWPWPADSSISSAHDPLHPPRMDGSLDTGSPVATAKSDCSFSYSRDRHSHAQSIDSSNITGSSSGGGLEDKLDVEPMTTKNHARLRRRKRNSSVK